MGEGLRALPEFAGGQGLTAGVQGGLYEDDGEGSGMGGMAWRDIFSFSFERINRKGREGN